MRYLCPQVRVRGATKGKRQIAQSKGECYSSDVIVLVYYHTKESINPKSQFLLGGMIILSLKKCFQAIGHRYLVLILKQYQTIPNQNQLFNVYARDHSSFLHDVFFLIFQRMLHYHSVTNSEFSSVCIAHHNATS